MKSRILPVSGNHCNQRLQIRFTINNGSTLDVYKRQIIVDNMKNNVLRPRIKLLQKQPPQSTRLEFVNAILNGFDGWKFMADLRCRKFTEDMIYQQKNSDGTKSKKKVLNPKTGGKEERCV